MNASAPDFFRDGWCVFPFDSDLAQWVAAALPHARATLTSPEHARWWRYQDTWFAGVNALDNDALGALGNSGPLRGQAVEFIRDRLGHDAVSWDRAQVSVCRPGYPQPQVGESDALHDYRRNRDAAHVDGLRREGPERRRFLREYHGFILGIPMAAFDPGASPFVVWRGSHEIMRAAFRARFAGLPPDTWAEEDVTACYHAARRQAFETCSRVPLHARPGEAYLVHRLALHGMAPWQADAEAGEDGRMIVYFRPEIGGPADWLEKP